MVKEEVGSSTIVPCHFRGLFVRVRITSCHIISIIISECVSVCARVISKQLNQENGKSYGTGVFGKVQRKL